MGRTKKIVKISIYGIIVNLVLVGFKAVVGLIANSISIILDALNNLTDAMSSIVTIIGVKLAEKKPDAKHPFGFGRVEYFSAVVVAMIVLMAGVMAFRESIEKIITPEEADYSIASLVIIALAVLVKFFFGQYVKKKGRELNSGSLTASGIDAISDAALSASVLAGALISFIWHISLEGYIGILISVMIIKTAISILSEAVNNLIGTQSDKETAEKVRKTVSKYNEVRGVYDLALHNYGPNKVVASAHIEIDDSLKTRDIHRLCRRIEVEIYEKYGIILTLGVYASNNSGIYKAMKAAAAEIIKRYETIKQMHGFYVDEEYKVISLDLVFDFKERNAGLKIKEIRRELKKKYPDYSIYIIQDTDTI